jgi:hypothetical protein
VEDAVAMSQDTALALLRIPPVRGSASLLFLFMVTALPLQQGDLGLWGRLGLGVLAVMLGTAVWVSTLRGFLRDVREPRRVGEAVVVAHRPRRAARFLSWVALGVVVLDGLWLGAVAGTDVPDAVLVPALLAFVVALPVASLLPRLSRWYADGGGRLAVSPRGLTVVPDGAGAELLPWGSVSPHEALAGLSRRVRWRPGARAAVERWAEEGFTPTAAEVHGLHLEPAWSADPEAVRVSWPDRVGAVALQGWALLACGLLSAAMIWATATGHGSWWTLLLFGWAPVLGTVILAPRVVRILCTGERRPARVTPGGWVDHLHGQGLVPWERLDRIEVRERHTLLVSRVDAPPFRDRDLGNRLNAGLDHAMESWPASRRIPSAGPLFREIGPRHLSYPPETRAFALAEEAERLGRVEVRWGGGSTPR